MLKQVIDIVFPRLESSAWWASPEMVLQSLLCSTNATDRKFTVEKILKLRAEADPNSGAPVRTHHKAQLNKEATSLVDLIFWEED